MRLDEGFPTTVRALRDCAAKQTPLPGAAYGDDLIYRLESSTLFRENWVGLTCTQVVPNPGDLFPVQICGLSLLVVRQKDKSVKVFYNLCRHRGARLVDQPCAAKAGLMICPYHAWSYRLDGALGTAPEYARDGANTQPGVEEKQELGLIEVPSELWREVVFVSLADQPTSFQQWIKPIDQYLAEWNPGELEPLGTREFSIRVNWKLAAENFLDAYHLPVVHPQLGGGLEAAGAIEQVDLAPHIIGFRMPMGYGSDSASDDGWLGGFTSLSERNRKSIEVFCIFPNTLILLEPDWQQVITLRPQSAGEVQETFADYLALGEQQLAADEREQMFGGSAEVNEQDKQLLESMQSSRSMPSGGLTMLSSGWDRTTMDFQKLWLEHMMRVLNSQTQKQETEI